MSIMAIIDSTLRIDDDRIVNCFFDNILKRIPTRIVIEQYTIEAEPIFKIIEHDGRVIKFTNDSSKTTLNHIQNYIGNRFEKRYFGNTIRYDLYYDDMFITKIIEYSKK
jgi:hypothetical protein